MSNENEPQKQWVIKSFVRHHGRLTDGQRKAFDEHWQTYGIDYNPEQLSESLFNGFSKVVFEIGFGNGESFIEMAENAPDTLFIGAEVHKPGVGRALKLAAEKGLKNVKVLMHDAVEIIDNMLPQSSVDRVQVYFPDPWHKKRHFKRRLIQAGLCLKLSNLLKDNGVLHIATDWEPYAEHCIEVLGPLSEFKNLSQAGNYVEKPAFRPETKFERRGKKLGHGVYDMLFEKR